MRDINKIVVHHTGSKLRGFDHPKLVKARHRYLRGFDDIGYHFLVGHRGIFTKDGKLYEGRPLIIEGAHALGHNNDSVGIAVIGNFEKEIPSDKQWHSLVNIVASNCGRFDLDVEDIYGHKELNPQTVCPGKNLDLDKLREDTSKLLYRTYEFVF